MGSKNQELFNFCTAHLRKQKKRSLMFWHGETIPAYRGFDNTRDPIQALIEAKSVQDLYIPEWENKTCKEEKFIRFLLTHWGYNVKLAFQIQQIHDTVSPEYWESEFEKLAYMWHLSYENPIKDSEYVCFSTYIKISLPSTNGDEIVETITDTCEKICDIVHRKLCEKFPNAKVNIGGNEKPCHHKQNGI